jgi:pimeloyl-ACP methyl ester carboxylesterase
MNRKRSPILLLAACVLVAGCAAPFGVRHASPQAVHRSLTSSVLTTGELSNASQIVLRRQNLIEYFDAHPAETLRTLRGRLQAGTLTADDLFALAELSFFHGERQGGKPHLLAAAVYAYAYVFPHDAATPDPLDPQLRCAVDIYNRALTEAFASADGEHVDIAGGTYPLPFGQIDVTVDEQQLRWGDRRLFNFSPSAELEIIGFRNRYRQAGIGAPLAAATQPLKADEATRPFIVGPHVKVPITALLRLPQPREQIFREELTATLELYPSTEGQTTEINGREIPLEQEPTAALGLALSEARPWTADIGRFLGQVLQVSTAPMIGGREPHRRGRIPVVLVHGTVSNFSVWANMVNDLDSDPVLRKHFEFWFFRYDSGQPILYSTWQLRSALTATVDDFQRDGGDPCLDQMVVIGHSQGGLLTKGTAIHSGDLFWRNVSDEPIDESDLPDETRTLMKQVMFIEPLPFVRRVVFIATPQRGSYLAGPQIVRRLAQRLITLPGALAGAGVDIVSSSVGRTAGIQRLPTSIDNMSPGHPYIRTISGIPVAPGIAAHSIIGAPGSGLLETRGDGVVKYTSAHIDGVESELTVDYEHSMQSKPEVVNEVQRILHRHLDLTSCADSSPDVQSPD